MNTLAASLERLFALRTFGIKPGLEPELALLERLGHPEQAFAAIHVAGTNGKGSVCAMLESILRTAGLKVGLYTSPHLVRFNERIRVQGEPIADAELAELFDLLEPHAAAVRTAMGGRDLTFFEFTTALAFEHFRRHNVNVAVIEVGMGGRLDATNVLHPLIAVITRIGLDHIQYLGGTIEEIAAEKAGIVKNGRPVVCGATPDAARDIIQRTARERGARFVDAAACVGVRRVAQDITGQKVSISSSDAEYGTVSMSLLGKHQLENIATAVAAVETLAACSPLAVPPETLRRGLAATQWPGRLQVLLEQPPVILDGAHNPDGAHALAATLKDLFKKRPIGLVWGMCEDKDTLGFAKALGGVVRRCWTVPIDTERSLAPGKLAALARSEGWETTTATVADALREAQAWARAHGGAVCIAGSLFLAGEVLSLDWRRLLDAAPLKERAT